MNTTTTRTRWATRILTGLVAAAFLPGAIMKVSQHPTVVAGFAQSGIPAGAIVPIGIVEFTCLAVFLVPRTTVLGTLLLTGYLGGAVLANVIHGSDFFHALAIGLIVWIAACLRVPEFQAVLLRREGATAPVARQPELVPTH